MKKRYIDIPLFTTFHDISSRNYTLSATQYKKLCIKNDNTCPVSGFLDRELVRTDLGNEVGSESYVEDSEYMFIKTKALQAESFLINERADSVKKISPKNFVNINLKKGDLLISKDSNVGEIIILDKDYENAMICGGIYRLPVSKNKYYFLAFMKSDLIRYQIDFLIPRGSTIRHGQKKFLDCLIPLPNKNIDKTIIYVEKLVKAIINKEIEIRKKHMDAMKTIKNELELNQKDKNFKYELPTINEIMSLDRMDSSIYSEAFKKNEFFITNYKNGFSTIDQLGFRPSRGQNLQVSNIGKSIYASEYREGYYTLVLPKFLSIYGTVNIKQYLGNYNNLKTMKKGEIIFGAEGSGRSMVVIDEQEKTITNIHGITLTQSHENIRKGVFVKLFLDYYRNNGMIDSYAVGGNGGSLAIKYLDYLKFPNFPNEKEKEVASFYYNGMDYDSSQCSLDNFEEYDNDFNAKAGIYEIDKSMKYLKQKLEVAIDSITDDRLVNIIF